MIRKTICMAAIAAIAMASQAQAAGSAAQVVGLKGKVMVSDAGKAAVAADQSVLRPGARVLAGADGAATIKYADGCVVNVAANSASTVSAKSPCAAGLVTSASPMQFGELTTTQVIMTGLGVVFLAFVIDQNSDDDDIGVSP